MGTKTRSITLLLSALLIASSSIFVQAFTIDSIAKPSVPEFSVKIVSHPYDVQPVTTTTIDQYTGKETTTTTPGYHVENKSIEVTIKNQPFTPYTVTNTTIHYHSDSGELSGETHIDETVRTADLFYEVQIKGHYGQNQDWKTCAGGKYESYAIHSNVQYGSEYTVITIKTDNYPAESVLDFRVKALEGYYLPWGRSVMILGYDFYGQESDYSSIKVLTMGEVGSTAVPIDAFTDPTAQPTPTTSPTQTPIAEPTQTPTDTDQSLLQGNAAFEATWQNIAIVLLCIIVAGLTVTLIFIRKRSSGKPAQIEG